MFRGFWRLARAQAKGVVGSGAEPDGLGDRWGIRPVGIDRRPWPLLGAGLGRAAEVGEDLGDHGWMLDGGDDLQGAAAAGAVFQVDIEHPFERAGPTMRAGAAAGDASACPLGYGRWPAL